MCQDNEHWTWQDQHEADLAFDQDKALLDAEKHQQYLAWVEYMETQEHAEMLPSQDNGDELPF